MVEKQYITYKIPDISGGCTVKLPERNLGDDEGSWITINGTHILIKDGETAGDAFKRTTGQSLTGTGGSAKTAQITTTKKGESSIDNEAYRAKGKDNSHFAIYDKNGNRISQGEGSSFVTPTEDELAVWDSQVKSISNDSNQSAQKQDQNISKISNTNGDARALISDGALNKEAKLDGYKYADTMEGKIPQNTKEYGSASYTESAPLQNYSENEYEYINSALRSGKFDNSEYGNMKNNIDEIIDNSPPIPSGIELYRGVGETSGKSIANAKVGSVISDAAFQSYSLNPATASGFAKTWGDNPQQTVIRVVTTGNEKGVYINTESHKEHEMIIARDTSWKIVKKESVDSINSKVHIITVVKSDE